MWKCNQNLQNVSHVQLNINNIRSQNATTKRVILEMWCNKSYYITKFHTDLTLKCNSDSNHEQKWSRFISSYRRNLLDSPGPNSSRNQSQMEKEIHWTQKRWGKKGKKQKKKKKTQLDKNLNLIPENGFHFVKLRIRNIIYKQIIHIQDHQHFKYW